MRHILVDYARQRASGKRGGDVRHVTLDGDASVSEMRDPRNSLRSTMWQALAKVNPRGSKVVELRYFGA